MKRILLISLILGMLLSATGCSAPVQRQKDREKISVVTTIFPPYDFVREIAGDRVELKMLLKPGTESHSYEPSPSDIVAIQDCDLFVYNGGESDTWVDYLLSSMEPSGRKELKMMDCVEALEEETVEGMQGHEEEHGHSGGEEYDEHVWTSPVNAVRITEQLTRLLIELDPEHESGYLENSAAYTKKLNALDLELRDIAANGKRTVLAFGDRFPFRYLAAEYKLSYLAAFPGCSSESEPSAQTVAYLVDTVRVQRIPVIFYLEFSNHKIADTVAQETGAQTRMLHSCHNISQQEMGEGETYLSLMTRNAEMIKEALN